MIKTVQFCGELVEVPALSEFMFAQLVAAWALHNMPGRPDPQPATVAR